MTLTKSFSEQFMSHIMVIQIHIEIYVLWQEIPWLCVYVMKGEMCTVKSNRMVSGAVGWSSVGPISGSYIAYPGDRVQSPIPPLPFIPLSTVSLSENVSIICIKYLYQSFFSHCHLVIPTGSFSFCPSPLHYFFKSLSMMNAAITRPLLRIPQDSGTCLQGTEGNHSSLSPVNVQTNDQTQECLHIS